MRHAILGVGGVGGLIAAALARCGEEVTLVLRPECIDSYPEQLQVSSCFGDMCYSLPRCVLIDTQVDCLWITTKSTQLNEALRRLAPRSELAAVIPLLNGVDHIPFLRQRFGTETVIPATIEVESERTAPGIIRHLSPFARLNLAASGRQRLEALLVRLAQVGFQYRFFDNEAMLLWSKLVFLGPLALTTAASGLNAGEVMSDAHWQKMLSECVDEYCRAGNAAGADLEEKKVLNVLASVPRDLRTSMQKDVAAGQVPEIDAIAGPVIRAAEAHDFSAAATREMISLIQRSMIEHV
jgi:2-dehydropantoate 2-reductase